MSTTMYVFMEKFEKTKCQYFLVEKKKILSDGIHAIPHTVRQNLTEFWLFWALFPIRFSNLREFSYHFISYFF